MRCPRCESSNGDDFFQNTVRQSRTVGGGNVLEGGLGSFEFDSQFWTCKKCMVRCVSDEVFEKQQRQAKLLNMTPEERKAVLAEEEKESMRKFVEENGREPFSDLTVVLIAIPLFGLVGCLVYSLGTSFS